MTLTDCLACRCPITCLPEGFPSYATYSGCVTSAETVLIEMQTHLELLKVLEANAQQVGMGCAAMSTCDYHIQSIEHERSVVVVSLSPQSCASLAAKYQLTVDQVRYRALPLPASVPTPGR